MGSSFSRLFRGGPNDTNDTNTTIQEYIVAAKKAEEAQKNAENAAKAAENREKAYTRLAEEATEARVRAENAAAEARREVQEDRERLEEAIRQAQAASKRAEEALKAAEEQRIHAEEQRMVLASQLEQAQTYLRRGLQPVVWPTDEEFKNAKKRVQYRPDSLHFAVCGFTGTGKSSLINAVRGLANHENGTAPTGVVETTMKIQRYPDTRKEDPFPRFVWFDVPGGGGAKVTDWQYFNEQGLFIFDVIVVVYDTRVTKLDISILENCRRFNIPAFIVRTKADNHIRQTMKYLGYTKQRKAEKERFYTEACEMFVNETRDNLEETLISANLPDQRVYIISSENVCNVTKGEQAEKIIDEERLIRNLIMAAHDRRYDTPPDTSE